MNADSVKLQIIIVDGSCLVILEKRNVLSILNKGENKYGKFRYIFQQDDASSHKTIKTYNFIEKYSMVLYNWSSNSPDLSPIEMVWPIMKNKLMT